MKWVIVGPHINTFKAFAATSRGVADTLCAHLSEDGVYFQNMDTSHSAMYDAWFPKEWFSEYLSSESDVILMDAKMVHKVFGCIPTSCTKLMFTLHGDKMILTVYEDKKVIKEFDIALLDTSEVAKMDVRVKDDGVGADFIMRSKDLYDIIHEHSQFGTNMNISVNEDEVSFVTPGEVTQRTFLSVIDDIRNFVLEDKFIAKNTYGVGQLEKMLKYYSVAVDVKVSIDHPDSLPLTLIFGDGLYYVRAFIAPMIDE